MRRRMLGAGVVLELFFQVCVLCCVLVTSPVDGLITSGGLSRLRPATPAAVTVGNNNGVVTNAAVGGISLQDLQVGSFDGGADVVFNGDVQKGWRVDTPAVIGPAEIHTKLRAQFPSAGVDLGVALSELAVLSSDPSVATARGQSCIGTSPNCVEVAPGRTLIGGSTQALVTEVSYDCFRAGAAGLTVAYRFASPQLAPIELSITKECTARQRRGLYVGTSLERSDDVIHDGASRWVTSTSAQRVIPDGKTQVSFFVALRAATGADGTAAQFMAAPKVVVTPLDNRRWQKSSVAQEIGRWQRRLLQRQRAEVQLHHQGYWGLPSRRNTSGVNSQEEVVRAHVVGKLATHGGFLQVMQGVGGPNEMSPSRLDVKFDCLARGAALVEVELTPQPAYQPYRPMVVSFVKRCGGDVQKGFDVSMNPLPNAAAVASPVAHSTLAAVVDLIRDGTQVGPVPKVDNLQSTLTVQWRSRRTELGSPDVTRLECGPAGIVEAYLSPAKIDEEGKEMSHGVLVGNQTMHFACRKLGRASCALRFGWKLYDGPVFQFQKECGGERADVRVESDVRATKPGGNGGLRSGAVLLQESVSPPRGLQVDPPLEDVTLPPEEANVTFNVFLDRKLRAGDEILRFLRPHLSIGNPNIVKAHITGLLGNEHAEEIELRGVKDGSADLGVEMECVGTGTSSIEVTLPLGGGQAFKPLVFAFSKRCESKSGIHGQVGLIALAIFGAIFSISCCTVTACIRQFEAELSHNLPKPPQPHKTNLYADHAHGDLSNRVGRPVFGRGNA